MCWVEICLVQKAVSVVFPLPLHIAVAELIKFSNGSYTNSFTAHVLNAGLCLLVKRSLVGDSWREAKGANLLKNFLKL